VTRGLDPHYYNILPVLMALGAITRDEVEAPWNERQKRNAAVTEITEIPDRGHSLTIDHGWKEVADTALAFVKQHVSPSA
jgi:hypothetical protein